ncbi:MAG: hypothetical protein NTZ40_00070 [Cyanobacteria bacterium]|nr:hypothetical protein [Cyanobacteriota bacterium]
MLRNVLLGVTSIIPTFMVLPTVVLPAVAAEPLRAPAVAAIAPITLAEVTRAEANAIAPIAQQSLPLPAEPQPLPVQKPEPAPSPQPAVSPWAGTLEIYGFTPLRATSSVTRGASQRDLPDLLGTRDGERNLDLPDGIGDSLGDRLPGLSYPDRWEELRGKLSGRSIPDQIEIPGFTAVTDVGLGTILEHLTDIFFVRGSVEYKRVGFQSDLSYVGLGGETAKSFTRRRRFFPDLPVPTRTLKTQVAISQGVYDFALRYRFGERERAIGTPGSVTVIPYAGVRVVDVGVETTNTFQGPLALRNRDFSFGNPITQPLLGLQGQVFVSPRLRLFARGDLGGFGANGDVDMSGNAQIGVGYAIGNSTQLDLSWRYLYLARDNGQTPNAAYTIDQNGIEVGVKFFF